MLLKRHEPLLKALVSQFDVRFFFTLKSLSLAFPKKSHMIGYETKQVFIRSRYYYYCKKPVCKRCTVTQLVRVSDGLFPLSWFVREGIRVITQQSRALTICMENPAIPGRTQMERFIPVEIFRKKSNTFRGITFFPFLPKRPKFSVPFVWITSARLHVERKRKIYRYFVNGTTQSRSCFRCQKNTSTI